jgi:bla regulator protein blaR1
MESTLIRASIDGAVIVGLVWLMCRALPGLSPSTRTFLWWCAAAKFLISLVWIAPVQIPVLPASATSPTAIVTRSTETASELTVSATAERSPSTASRTRSWGSNLFAAWAIGAVIILGIGVTRWWRTARVIRRSIPASTDVEAMVRTLGQRLHLRQLPAVRQSDQIETPLVGGLFRPTVLIPSARFGGLTERQREMALCHELAHVKRADLWMGSLPALAERLFFFHPFVHVAAREYALWREAACDAMVIDALDAAPQEYGRLLLDLGLARRQSGLAAAGASWSFHSLKRRIAMLRTPVTRSFGAVGIAAGVIAVAAMVPLQLTARAALVDEAALQSNARASRDQKAPDDTQQLNYILFYDEHRTTMSGDTRDIERAKRFKRPGEAMLWFRRGGNEYVVRDQALLQQIEALWAPVGEIGDRQGALGEKQGELGTKQGELGARQGDFGAEQGRIGALQGELGALQAELATREAGDRNFTAAERRKLETDKASLEKLLRNSDEDMKALDAKMRELDAPMRDLDKQMKVLDEQMQALDKEMNAAVKTAETDMRKLLERAIATGAAEQVR